MLSARSASSSRPARVSPLVGVVAALLVAAGHWPSGQRLAAAVPVPVRLHASAGWGQPAVGDRTVFYLSKDHQLFAVDSGTGAEHWRRTLNGEPRNGEPRMTDTTAGSRVVLESDVVIAGDGDLFAFDARSGWPRWRTFDESGVPGRFLGSVAGRGRVCAGTATGTLACWQVATGQEHWRARVAGIRVTIFAPVVDDDLVLAAFTDFGSVPRSGGVVAVGASDGRPRWLTRFPRTSTVLAAGGTGPPAASGGIVAAASTDGTLYGLNRATGLVQWTVPPVTSPAVPRHPSPGAEHEDFRAVKSSGSRLVVTSLTGVLTAVELDTRHTAWRFQSPPDGSNGFGLTVHGPLVYVPFASGRLLIIDAHNGRQRHVLGKPTQRFYWPPTAAGRRIYLTAEDGLYVVDIE